jgi:antitoxin HigA-1
MPPSAIPTGCPTHPGELLRDAIPATGKTKTEIAALFGISASSSTIFSEHKPVSRAAAARRGKLYGFGTGAWVRMQGACDARRAERELADQITKIAAVKPVAA